jgi:hypothetical protein
VVPCAYTNPLLHTPGAAFAFALGQDPWSYLTLSCTFPVLHLLLHSVRILVVYTYSHPPLCTPSAVFAGSGSLVVAPCTCLPSPMHSQCCCACLPSLMHSWHCCACSPSLMHSCTLPMQKGWTGERKQQGALTST